MWSPSLKNHCCLNGIELIKTAYPKLHPKIHHLPGYHVIFQQRISNQENETIQQQFSVTSRPSLSLCKISKVAMQVMPLRKCAEDAIHNFSLTQPLFQTQRRSRLRLRATNSVDLVMREIWISLRAFDDKFFLKLNRYLCVLKLHKFVYFRCHRGSDIHRGQNGTAKTS